MSIGNRIEQSVVEDKVDVNERFGLWGDCMEKGETHGMEISVVHRRRTVGTVAESMREGLVRLEVASARRKVT